MEDKSVLQRRLDKKWSALYSEYVANFEQDSNYQHSDKYLELTYAMNGATS